MKSLPYGDQGDGTYRNPVLYADYSDPDVIAVGADYYMTASSFNCTPGLPVLHSRDLVNWRIIGYAMEAFPFESYRNPQHGKGVWAPALRFYDGKFWIFFGAPDEGIFMTTAENPAGPWSPLHCVQEGKGLIDPCPFWDDDGQAYLVRAQAGSRCDGINSLLTLHRMAPDGTRLLDDGEVIVDGHWHHPTVEGPKLYKRNGYYYIFAPAGGVPGGWQTVFRSREIDGPYEDRIVLAQMSTPVNGPHQGAWVETVYGEHWFLHFQDKGHSGRILHLQPMEWGSDDWPLIGEPSPARDVTQPVLRHAKPKSAEKTEPSRLPASDGFEGDSLGWQWQWMANSEDRWREFVNPGLRLFCLGTSSGNQHWLEAANLLVQKPLDPEYAAEVEVDASNLRPGDRAGLLLTGAVWGGIYLERTEDGITALEARLPSTAARELEVDGHRQLNGTKARLSLWLVDGVCRFAVSDQSGEEHAVGLGIRPREAAWMGARIGLFALSPGRSASGGSAVYRNFIYTPIC